MSVREVHSPSPMSMRPSPARARLAFALLPISLLACGGDGGTGIAPTRARVTVADTSLLRGDSLLVGDSIVLAVVVQRDGAAGVDGTTGSLRSLQPEVASVSAGGVVRALAPGRTLIEASAGASRDTFRVVVTPDIAFTRVRARGLTTCALDVLGRPWCWGRALEGQLGRGEWVSMQEMDSVPALVRTSVRFADLANGGSHVCGLTSDGAAWCWGSGGRGQLGSEPTTNCTDIDGGPPTCAVVPQRVQGVPRLRLLSAGGSHTCGLATDGVAWCWGADAAGQLGDGDPSDAWGATPRPVAGTLRFTTLSAGGAHTCGLATDHTAWCWGAANRGQLGDSTALPVNFSTQPFQPGPRAVAGGGRYGAVAAAAFTTCAVDTAGTAWCWGFPARSYHDGTQPDPLGTSTTSNVPLTVSGGTGLSPTWLDAGANIVCGLRGEVVCWGRLRYIDDGSSAPVYPPAPAVSGSAWASFSSADLHACGILASGSLACIGNNFWGQLGNGTRRNAATPVRPVYAR